MEKRDLSVELGSILNSVKKAKGFVAKEQGEEGSKVDGKLQRGRHQG